MVRDIAVLQIAHAIQIFRHSRERENPNCKVKMDSRLRGNDDMILPLR
jgi:hypothetical protein